MRSPAIPTTPMQGRILYLRAQIECCEFFLFTVEGSKCDKVDPVQISKELKQYRGELSDIVNGKATTKGLF